MEQKTPLYECHLAAGGKLVPFAGYLLPVQYESSGIIAEHMAVRESCGLFDVSHMGEISLFGPDALLNIEKLMTNSFLSLQIGAARYSPMCNESGGVIDDLLVYRTSENCYLIVVNAANRHKDAAWIQSHLAGDVQFADISDELAQLALQGPFAEKTLLQLTREALPTGYYTFVREIVVAGVTCLVSRTGYTGEDGFELYCAGEKAPHLWNALLKAGSAYGIRPCGLGARDTLRLEAAMPLYGHEMDESTTPFAAGLGWAVKLKKDSFIGKDALLAQGAPKRRRAGLVVTGRGIAREGCRVFKEGQEIGKITSGTHSPYLKKAIAMASLGSAYTEPETEVQIEVRGRNIDAVVTPLPFYRRR